MIQFLIKGLLRDRQRSLLPLLVVSIGVMLTVFMHAWVTGVMGDSIEFNARFETGHVKITTRAYAENAGQIPIDLSLEGAGEMLEILHTKYPDMTWVERTRFGGLIDVPDESGETLSQGPVTGMALDLLNENSREKERMNLTDALVRGHFPDEQGEILISDNLFEKLGVSLGQEVTLITTSMYGSMVFHNFRISGTLSFGMGALDKGTLIIDLEDARLTLDMQDATAEILGFFASGYFEPEKAEAMCLAFNENYSNPEDAFSPLMQNMRSYPQIANLIDMADLMAFIITAAFILVMSIVLWNTGLISGLRRYGEMGVRLAIGESKGHVYRSLISESVAVGLAGSVVGTLAGLLCAYILQEKGLHFDVNMDTAAVMMPSTFRSHITPITYYVGFIPGLLSTVLGTMLSGIGIFKRKTAELFKELE
ncbi:MAG: ABC transporter permease [Bacteroidales bacterium]